MSGSLFGDDEAVGESAAFELPLDGDAPGGDAARSNTMVPGMRLRYDFKVGTGKDGYVHVRMIDNAFVAVRPESKFAVEIYEYDAEMLGSHAVRALFTEARAA